MKFTLTLTADDYIKARRLAMRPRPALRYIGIAVIVLYVISLVWQLIENLIYGHFSSGFWQMLGLGVYLYAIFFIWMPFRVRKIFKQQKTLQVSSEVEFTDSHFLASSPNGTFQMPWKDFHKWKKNKEMVLIYQSEAIMHMIPFRSFQNPEDVSEVSRILTSNLGKEKP